MVDDFKLLFSKNNRDVAQMNYSYCHYMYLSIGKLKPAKIPAKGEEVDTKSYTYLSIYRHLMVARRLENSFLSWCDHLFNDHTPGQGSHLKVLWQHKLNFMGEKEAITKFGG